MFISVKQVFGNSDLLERITQFLPYPERVSRVCKGWHQNFLEKRVERINNTMGFLLDNIKGERRSIRKAIAWLRENFAQEGEYEIFAQGVERVMRAVDEKALFWFMRQEAYCLEQGMANREKRGLDVTERVLCILGAFLERGRLDQLEEKSKEVSYPMIRNIFPLMGRYKHADFFIPYSPDALYLLAIFLVEHHRLEDAIIEIGGMYRGEKSRENVYTNLAEKLFCRGKVVEAQRICKIALVTKTLAFPYSTLQEEERVIVALAKPGESIEELTTIWDYIDRFGEEGYKYKYFMNFFLVCVQEENKKRVILRRLVEKLSALSLQDHEWAIPLLVELAELGKREEGILFSIFSKCERDLEFQQKLSEKSRFYIDYLLFLVAKLWIEKGEVREALHHLQSVQVHRNRMYPTLLVAYLERGKKEGRGLEESLEFLERVWKNAIKRDKDISLKWNELWSRWVVEALIKVGEVERAFEMVERGEAASPSLESFFLIGVAKGGEREWVHHLLRSGKYESYREEAILALSKALIEQGKREEGLEEIKNYAPGKSLSQEFFEIFADAGELTLALSFITAANLKKARKILLKKLLEKGRSDEMLLVPQYGEMVYYLTDWVEELIPRIPLEPLYSRYHGGSFEFQPS